jgi:hypothetical protein
MTQTLTPGVTTTASPPARRLLALAMGAAPILLLAGTAVLPSAIGGQHGAGRAKALHVLRTVAPDRARLPVGLVLVIAGLALLTAAAFGLSWLARGSRLSVTGAALVLIGAPMGAAANAVTALVAYRLTDPHLSQSSAVDVYAGTPGAAGAVVFLLYLLVLPGMILLAIAAWRSRALTWWQAALIGVGVLLGLVAGEGPTGALFSLPLCAGLLIAARRLIASSP